ncbi:hypothetical protein CYY_010211, partial [Polysphondylium violaceum]
MNTKLLCIALLCAILSQGIIAEPRIKNEWLCTFLAYAQCTWYNGRCHKIMIPTQVTSSHSFLKADGAPVEQVKPIEKVKLDFPDFPADVPSDFPTPHIPSGWVRKEIDFPDFPSDFPTPNFPKPSFPPGWMK